MHSDRMWRKRERGIQDKLRPLTMLSQNPKATPLRAQPHFLANKTSSLPPTHYSTRLQPTNQATSRLPAIATSPSLAAPGLRVPPNQELLGWRSRLSICQAWPMGIQAIQERVGYIPAGSSDWGRGASSCYTFCESEHMEGKGKQSRLTPTTACKHATTHCSLALTPYSKTHTP